jgi:hypothetical protein
MNQAHPDVHAKSKSIGSNVIARQQELLVNEAIENAGGMKLSCTGFIVTIEAAARRTE